MGFSFDGTASKNMGILSRMPTENRVPELRNRTIEIAGRDGLLDLGSSFSERVIEISCLITPKRTQADFLDCKDRIVHWLSPDKGTCELILDTEPERVYYARLQSGVTFEKAAVLAATFDLTFFCPDPFGYAIEDEFFTIVEQGSQTVMREKGNIESSPVYRIQGQIPSVGGSIAVTTNGVELCIQNAGLVSGETLVVDSEKMTAWVENEDGDVLRNALPYINELNFPALNAGNNTISVSAENAEFTELEIQANSRWR